MPTLLKQPFGAVPFGAIKQISTRRGAGLGKPFGAAAFGDALDVAGAAHTVTLTPATETDAAVAFASSSNTVLSALVPPLGGVAIGALPEIGPKQLGPVSPIGAVAFGATAGSGAIHSVTLSPVLEANEAAGTALGVPISPATETDAAQPLVSNKAGVNIIPATEADIATPVSFKRLRTLNPATETDTALALGITRTAIFRTIVVVSTADSAQKLSRRRGLGGGPHSPGSLTLTPKSTGTLTATPKTSAPLTLTPATPGGLTLTPDSPSSLDLTPN